MFKPISTLKKMLIAIEMSFRVGPLKTFVQVSLERTHGTKWYRSYILGIKNCDDQNSSKIHSLDELQRRKIENLVYLFSMCQISAGNPNDPK